MSEDVLLDNHEIEHVIEAVGRRLRERRGAPAARGGPDPDWTNSAGRPIASVAHEHVTRFHDSMAGLPLRDFHGAVLQKVTDGVLVTGVQHVSPKAPPQPRDLLHVYGPDRDNTRARRYYRFAWTDATVGGGMIVAKQPQIIGQGLLQASAYAYSGQSVFAVTGAGMLFTPEHGAARVSVRPYLPWRTTASFTHSTWDEEPEATRASVSCLLGIVVDSWRPGATTVQQERDHWITAYAHQTTQLLRDVPESGTATVSDGLATDFVAVPGRRYAIYVYAWLEAAASPQVHKNQSRFCTIDVDASVPFLVAKETLL